MLALLLLVASVRALPLTEGEGTFNVSFLSTSEELGGFSEISQHRNSEEIGRYILHILLPNIDRIMCRDGYNSFTCLKMAVAGLMPALAMPRKFAVWPGLAVVSGGFEAGTPPTPAKLDVYLARGLHSFLSSLSLHVHVLDQEVDQRFNNFSRALTEGQETQRARKKKYNNALLLGGLLSAGTLLALGMAAISAMAGKAMLMSLASMGVMLLNRNKGNGGNGHSKTTYEIVHTPVPHEEHHNTYEVIKGHR